MKIVGLLLAITFYSYMYFAKKFTTLIMCFLCIFLALASIYLAYNAQYLAFIQLLIYIGGILLLTLFGMMFIPRGYRDIPHIENRSFLSSVLISTGVFYILLYSFDFSNVSVSQSQTTIKEVGSLFFSNYLLIFELIAVILLLSLVGVSYIEKKN